MTNLNQPLASQPLARSWLPESGSSRTVHDPVPKVWGWLLRWFGAYTQTYLRRHFHCLRISKRGLVPEIGTEPVVIYVNHASWWDPLVCLFLQRQFFAGRNAYAPIDAGALKRYPMFQRLGFFGVEQGSGRGALRFVRTAQAILEQSKPVLWITPQGQFQDVRRRPVEFRSGLGHLAQRVPCGIFVPLAVEYAFWDERLPEVLVRFGEPVRLSGDSGVRSEPAFWTTLFQQKLEKAQNALAEEAQTRDPQCFQVLLRGRAGVGAIYDGWRSLQARWRGEQFKSEHSAA